MTDAKDLLQVKRGEGAAFPFEGTMTYLKEGLIAHKDHPIVRGREAHFEPLIVHFDVSEPEAEKAKGQTSSDTGQSEAETEPKSDASTAGTVKSAASRTQGSRAR